MMPDYDNAHHPAYWEGYYAQQEGVRRMDNPYYMDQPEGEEWDDGWCDAAWDE